MGINLVSSDANAYSVQTSEVVIKDSFMLFMDGEVVASLDAKYDFSRLPTEYHAAVANMLMEHRLRVERVSEAKKLAEAEAKAERDRQQKAEFEALPWWKRLFGPRPL